MKQLLLIIVAVMALNSLAVSAVAQESKRSKTREATYMVKKTQKKQNKKVHQSKKSSKIESKQVRNERRNSGSSKHIGAKYNSKNASWDKQPKKYYETRRTIKAGTLRSWVATKLHPANKPNPVANKSRGKKNI